LFLTDSPPAEKTIKEIHMSTLTVLMAGVSLVFGLQATERFSRAEAAHAAMQQHDYAKAGQLYRECVDLSATSAQRATARASYGIALHLMDRNSEAKVALEQALAEWADARPSDRVVTLGVLAAVDRSLGDYPNAERIYRVAIEDPSGSQSERATLMVNLADLLREEGREREASAVLNDAARMTGLSQQEQTSILVETAELTREMHLLDVSIGLWNKVGDIARRERSVRLEEVFTGGLGETWFVAGNLARAEPLLRRSLELLRDDPSTPPSQMAVALSLMASVYICEDKLALAEDALHGAIARDQEIVGPEHPQMAVMLELRAEILSRRGEAQSARDDLERARVIMSGHLGANSNALAGVYAALGDVEMRSNQPAAAVPQYEAAMRLLGEDSSDGARFRAALVSRYAAALKAAHRPGEARALLAASAQSSREK
jgi:tetratricopeptide (TPR) repeat protein